MDTNIVVKVTENFERNLESIEQFLTEADASQAYDTLLDTLAETCIPNLERFPGIGRPFNERPVGSVEVSNALDAFQKRLHAVSEGCEVREYIMADYLMLYVLHEEVIYLLAIRHHRQLSFDLAQILD